MARFRRLGPIPHVPRSPPRSQACPVFRVCANTPRRMFQRRFPEGKPVRPPGGDSSTRHPFPKPVFPGSLYLEGNRGSGIERPRNLFSQPLFRMPHLGYNPRMRAACACVLAACLHAADAGLSPRRFDPRHLRLRHEAKTAPPTDRTPGVLSGDAEYFAAVSPEKVVVYRTRTGQIVAEIDGSAEGIHDGAFSFDGRLYAVAHNDGSVKIWNLREKKIIGTCHTGGGYSCAVAFTRDGRRLVGDIERESLAIWDPATGKEEARIEGTGSSYTYISPNGRYATASSDALRLVDLEKKTIVAELLPEMVEWAAFSPDSRHVVAAQRKTLIRWETASGRRIDTYEAKGVIHWAQYSPDGRYIAMAVAERGCCLLRSSDLTVAGSIPPPAVPVEGEIIRPDAYLWMVGFARDGRSLVGVYLDGTIRIYSNH